MAESDDASSILAIYAPFCINTPVTFESEPPPSEEIRRRIACTIETLPWLVREDAGAVVGYAYAVLFRPRAAYRWSTEVTVYVAEHARRGGVATGLYSALLALLRLQGYHNAYAGITLPNPASVGLHESFGFSRLGVYRRVGYKLGAWHDVGAWHLELQASECPSETRPIGEVLSTAQGARVLAGVQPPHRRGVATMETAE